MELIKAFLNYLYLEKKYSKHTIDSYKNDLVSFFKYVEKEFEGASIEKVHYAQIRSWIVFLVQKKISNNSVNRKMSSLKSFYKFLIKTKTISVNPLQKHKSLKVPKRVNVPFNKKEIEEVLSMLNEKTDYISLRNKLIVELFYTTGIRRSELIGLKLSDIDLKQNTIKVLGKRNKERYIPVLNILQRSIIEYLKKRKEFSRNKEYLFLTQKQKKLYGTLVYRLINNYFSSVSTKVKKSPHVLRHAFATHLLNEGADLNAVKELLGHASLASTQVYTNSSLSELKNVYNRAHPRSSSKK